MSQLKLIEVKSSVFEMVENPVKNGYQLMVTVGKLEIIQQLISDFCWEMIRVEVFWYFFYQNYWNLCYVVSPFEECRANGKPTHDLLVLTLEDGKSSRCSSHLSNGWVEFKGWKKASWILPGSLTARPWKMMVGRSLSFWHGNFSGAKC